MVAKPVVAFLRRRQARVRLLTGRGRGLYARTIFVRIVQLAIGVVDPVVDPMCLASGSVRCGGARFVPAQEPLQVGELVAVLALAPAKLLLLVLPEHVRSANFSQAVRNFKFLQKRCRR